MQILINVITGSETDSDRIACSDLNDDGVTNIFDLQQLINIIISGGKGAPLNSTDTTPHIDSTILIKDSSPSITFSAQKSTTGPNTLILPDIQLQQKEENTFGLGLSNVDVVASGQIRFTYNSTIGFEITGAGLTSRTNGYADPVFQVDDSDSTNVKVLVLFYTFGSPINSGTGDILEFNYKTTTDGQGATALTFIEHLLSDQSADSLPVTSQDGNASFNIVTANAGADTSICSGACAAIGGSPAASGGTGHYTYAWTPATGLSSATVANPTACPTTTTTYTLTVTDDNGHTDEEQVVITVKDCPIEVEAGEVKIQGGEKGYVNPGKGEDAKIILEPEESGRVTIRIYTLRGRLVWEETVEVSGGVRDIVTWACKNAEDEMVASGIYLVHIKGAGIDVTKKIAVVK